MKILSTARKGSAALALAMVSATTASGQSGRFADPADPAIAGPAARYESAFSGYKPFQPQTSDSWKQLNRTVADHPGIASMAGMSRDATPDTGSRKLHGETPTAGTGEHDMHAMHDMPQMTATGQESRAAVETENTLHAKAPPQPAAEQTTEISGTGIVQGIDRAGGKVKLAHDPIAALGWPGMTMFFRLKDGGLADQVKVGDKVGFTLEKLPSGYVISAFQKGATHHDMDKMK